MASVTHFFTSEVNQVGKANYLEADVSVTMRCLGVSQQLVTD